MNIINNRKNIIKTQRWLSAGKREFIDPHNRANLIESHLELLHIKDLALLAVVLTKSTIRTAEVGHSNEEIHEGLHLHASAIPVLHGDVCTKQSYTLQHRDDLDDPQEGEYPPRDEPQEGAVLRTGVDALDDPHEGDDPPLDDPQDGADALLGVASDQSGTEVCSLEISFTMVSNALGVI